VAVPVVTVEETGVVEALKRSSKLMDGFRGTAFGVLFVLALLNLGLSLAGGVVVGFQGQNPTLSSAMNLVLYTFNLGLTVVSGGLIYFAVRSYKESIGADAIAAVFE